MMFSSPFCFVFRIFVCYVRELGYGIEEINVFIELASLVARIHRNQKKRKKVMSFPNFLFY